MAKTTNRSSLLAIAALSLAGAVAGCGKELPSKPSYAADVLPIFQARCLRCHGDNVLPNDGGIFEPDASLLPAGQQKPASALVTYQAYLGRYDDSPECAVDSGLPTPPPGCQRGARYWAVTPTNSGRSNILSDVVFGGAETYAMPPPPARALSDWEATLIDSWTSNPLP
jgi:hypothetical protein